MRRQKWSVTRFKINPSGKTYGPKAKHRFTNKPLAMVVYGLARIEGLFTGYRPWIFYIPKYSIDTELSIEYHDSGPWRSYRLDASGDSLAELIKSATISEVDQDGGDLDCYSLDDSPDDVGNEALSIIFFSFIKAN